MTARSLASALLGLALLSAGAAPAAAGERAATAEPERDLRSRIAAALRDGLTAEELDELAAAALDEARAAGSRAAFWRSMARLADLCEAGPPLAVRPVRRRALAALARRPSDTLRWSGLVATAFLPPFERLGREAARAELAAYDGVLVELASKAAERAVRTELAWARIRARLEIDRRRDWLSARERAETVRWAERLEEDAGDELVPGGLAERGETQARRARDARYELEALAFGAEAPALAGDDLEGRPLVLADLRGRVVVLDFWNSFCQPCLALVPEARRLLAELAAPAADGDPALVWLGVCGDADRAQGRATARRHGMTWRNLHDGPDEAAAQAFRVAAVGWPAVFVLDRAGRIRAKLAGHERIERELEGVLRTLLAEPAPR